MGIEGGADPFHGQELEFPLVCHVKVIADAGAAGVQAGIERALEGLELLTSLSTGNHSAHGKFVTYNVSVRMHSKSEMEEFDAALRAVPGVRVVL